MKRDRLPKAPTKAAHILPASCMLDRLIHGKDPAQRAVQAPEGWLALGMAQAAWEELAAAKPERQTDPGVLTLAARILTAIGRMEEAREMVRRAVRLAPARRLALLDDPALERLWT